MQVACLILMVTKTGFTVVISSKVDTYRIIFPESTPLSLYNISQFKPTFGEICKCNNFYFQWKTTKPENIMAVRLKSVFEMPSSDKQTKVSFSLFLAMRQKFVLFLAELEISALPVD